jgi:hypothetical protein
MSNTEKIYEEGGQPVTLLHANGSVDCTLQEAVIARGHLPEKDCEGATIRKSDGTVYTAKEIDRLYLK